MIVAAPGDVSVLKERTLRQIAARIAAQLPDDAADAHRVLDLSAELVDGFLAADEKSTIVRSGGNPKSI